MAYKSLELALDCPSNSLELELDFELPKPEWLNDSIHFFYR